MEMSLESKPMFTRHKTELHRLAPHWRQRGAAGIEFTLVFPLFFVLFYAIVGYGLIMTVDQMLTAAAAEGARAAVAADPGDRKACPTDSTYTDTVTSLAREQVAATLNWLSPSVKSAVLGEAPGYNKIQVGLAAAGSSPALCLITVTLTYHYADAPLVPLLNFPLIGKVPNIPDDLRAYAQAELYAISSP